MLRNKMRYIIPALGFLSLIILGWMILMLPFFSKENTTIFDNLFTVVSSVCVNGFHTVDLSTSYTYWGQIIIAIMIEFGAIGFLTFISYILNIKERKIVLSETLLINDELNENNYGKIKQRLKKVIKYTLVIELVGSIFLSISFIPKFGISKGIWYSVFHSISAFCNAGFDLFGSEGFTIFAKDVYVNIIVIILMMLGSIGFFVIEDIMACIKKKSYNNMQFQTKIVLFSTIILYIVSFILIKIAEPDLSILQTLFISVALRTTGFCTVDINSVSNLTKFTFAIIMMIGAPSSTSGGFRITSIVVIIFYICSIIENKKDIIVFGRKIDTQVIKQAIINIFIGSLIILISVIFILKIEITGLLDALFMSISAFSTVGISTIELAKVSIMTKIFFMIIMFLSKLVRILVANNAFNDD